MEYGLEEITGFSMISDEQLVLDNLVESFMSGWAAGILKPLPYTGP